MSPKKLQFYVDGKWRESKADKYLPVTNASTGELIAQAPCCTAEEVNDAVMAARAAFLGWSSTPIQERTALMFKFKQILEANIDELTNLIATEMGKNLEEAKGEVFKVIEVVELSCAGPVLMQGDALMDVTRGHDTIMVREPVGVFAGIVPYNFPAMIPFGWMLPLCITTGNTFVLKAASKVPQTGIRLLEMLIEAGLPKGVVNFVMCSNEEAELLLKHPEVDGISYVGSTKVGRHVYATAAAHGKKVQALCEAKNHCLVLKDAALEASARRIINSTFGCAGQRCMALPVVVVEEAVADELVSYLIAFAKGLQVGCAYDKSTELGPVVSEEHKERVLNWIEMGIREGAKLVLDGRSITVPGHEGGFFIGPTIFDHVEAGMRIGEEEIFGPVTCIKRVKNFEEGLAVMNANPFANGSSIFTQSGYYAREFSHRTHGGMVGINVGIPVPTAYFPFTGHKNSFFGDLHVMGRDGVAFYTQLKTITSRWFEEDEAAKVNTWEGTITRK